MTLSFSKLDSSTDRLIPELGLPLAQQVIAIRRDLHRFAEPAWCEIRTTSKIVRLLQALGWEVRFGRSVVAEGSRMGMPAAAELERAYERALEQGADREIAAQVKDGHTGVLATLDTGRAGPTVALRFDIDANSGFEARDDAHLPTREGFASINSGAHHNCGHDGHAAIGIGVARALAECRDTLAGTIRLVFQPAEEGLRGAKAMVDAGLLDGVQALIACHVGVQALEKGTVIPGYRNLLGSTKFDALFEGRNAHAAISPQEGRNAMLAACAAVLQLYGIPRHGDGETRVNVGMITGGESRNAIPARVRICAELRGDTVPILSALEERAYAIVHGCAAAQGVSATIEQMGSSCPASSDANLVELIQRAAARTAGVTRVVGITDFKASDDAAVMMDAVQRQGGKAVYFGIGTQLADVHHNPRFDFDDSVLPMGVEILVNAVKEIART